MTAARKDRERLARFIRGVSGKAHDFARRLAGNSEDAKELVQEATFRLVRRWKAYHARERLEPLFMTIIRNAYLDRAKRCERRNLPLSAPLLSNDGAILADCIPGDDEPPERVLEREENALAVRQALSRLSTQHRRLLIACDIEGVEQRQAARLLGIPSGTVRSRLFRARRAFRAQASAQEI